MTPILMELLYHGIEFGPLAFASLRSRERGDHGDMVPRLGSGERGGVWPLCGTIMKGQKVITSKRSLVNSPKQGTLSSQFNVGPYHFSVMGLFF